MLNFIDDASLFNSFDESVASLEKTWLAFGEHKKISCSYAVICDRKPQSVFRLYDFDFLWSTLPMRENEVVESDLAAEKLRHVHFVWVQGAEKDLKVEKKN